MKMKFEKALPMKYVFYPEYPDFIIKFSDKPLYEKSAICSCFRDAINNFLLLSGRELQWHSKIVDNSLKKLIFVDKVCHECNLIKPEIKPEETIFYSVKSHSNFFKQYRWYIIKYYYINRFYILNGIHDEDFLLHDFSSYPMYIQYYFKRLYEIKIKSKSYSCNDDFFLFSEDFIKKNRELVNEYNRIVNCIRNYCENIVREKFGYKLLKIKAHANLLPMNFSSINTLVKSGQFKEALDIYYNSLKDRYFDELLIGEIFYIKRIAGIELSGRDLLYFRPASSITDFIKNNMSEYVEKIDEVLNERRLRGGLTPLKIMIDFLPTVEERISKKNIIFSKLAYLENGVLKIGTDFEDENCYKKGKLIDRYIDPFQFIEFCTEDSTELLGKGYWIKYSPKFIEDNITGKGLKIDGIDLYSSTMNSLWQIDLNNNGDDFKKITDLNEVKARFVLIGGIKYTGRNHIISNQMFYEVDIFMVREIWGNFKDFGKKLGSWELKKNILEILREGENRLRESHRLPQIGEGWVSEISMFDLVRKVFPDAILHCRPDWLKPQHLDIFIPSKKLGFEYQGKQHSEPVEYFGGKRAFEENQKRDSLKLSKCRDNGVKIIYWNYDESINEKVLKSKLIEAVIEF
ncbi:MAG: hypothetical protein PVH61_24360 [Candidatus Aminicenantes bacterium]|jgi:hypothetical protein